ncbi:MAG: spore cortex biosynthesis protein YabQ [Tissierellaceae bacterium]|nr:spore cortex biosynthesis protein YabQ [Tissierellaceae bacterium]
MSQINIRDEFYIFLIAINYGLILGGMYDFYRVFRLFSKPKKILTAIEDLLFWIIVTLIIFMFLLNKTDGIIRGFVILGFIVGYVFYYKVISKYSFLLLKKIFELIFSLISEIIRIISYPFKKVFKIFGKKTDKIGKMLKIALKDTKKYFKITRRKK